MKISARGYSSSMQITSCIMLYSLCTCLLVNVRPTSSVALNIPPSIQGNDSVLNTNSVVPEAGAEQASSAKTKNETHTTTLLANCTKNSTEKSYNESALIDSIRLQLLAKLDLTEAPSGLQAGAQPEITSLISSYHARLQTMQLSAEDPQDCPDKKITHYSRSVKLYYPDSYFDRDDDDGNDYFVLGDDADGKSEDATKPTSKAMMATSPDTDKNSFPPVHYRLIFDRLDLAPVGRLWSVVLELYKRKVMTLKSSGAKRGTNPSETVRVFQVVKKHIAGKLKDVYKLFTTKNVRSEHEGYVSFDITEKIKRWQEGSSQQRLELCVFIDTPEVVESKKKLPPIIMFDVPTYGKGEKKARMVVETLSDKESFNSVLNNGMQHRRKRAVAGVNSQYCFANSNETNCCIRRSTIDFERDYNWDWVLLPRSFERNYCSGECQNPSWPHATTSTKFLTKFRQNNPTAAAEPCCVPHEMASLTVLIVVNGIAMVRDIPDMIVKSCICR